MSELGSRGSGSAKDRRNRLYAALVNQRTGETRRPNQAKVFQAGNSMQFLPRGGNRYQAYDPSDIPF